MKLRVNGSAGGEVRIPASKSQAHRLLICAALAEKESSIECRELNDDIERTAECLAALGAEIAYSEGVFMVKPITEVCRGATLDCGESGSTLRFLLPVAAALGADATFVGHGRLPQRPLTPLHERMEEHGVKMSDRGSMPLECRGRMTGGTYEIAANVSSQFISGLLFALPLTGEESRITLLGNLESGSYIEMTLDALNRFGIEARREGASLVLPAGQRYISPKRVSVEGDWSAAAFWLAAGVIGKLPISCLGLNMESSRQGDRAVVEMLRSMGGRIEVEESRITAYPSKLRGCRIDCQDTPDLVPALAGAAAFAEGVTEFDNIARLRIKESDRVAAVCDILEKMGIECRATENQLHVTGGRTRSAVIDSFGDHRIAMTAAVVGLATAGGVEIEGAECVGKSYPAFFEHAERLGAEVTEITTDNK